MATSTTTATTTTSTTVPTTADFGPGKLVLIGGVQLNLPAPYEDHFQPLYYQVHQKGEAPIDCLKELCQFESNAVEITG